MKSFLYLSLYFLLVSCSLLNKMALRSTGDLIVGGSDEVLTESDWMHFKQAAPANLKFIEGLWFNEKSNSIFLTTLIKGYGAYTYGVLETMALNDVLMDETSKNISRTLLGYEKAIYYGHKLLALRGISKKDFYNKDFPKNLSKIFDAKIKEEDMVGIFYFAQALGSSINMQRGNIEKMGYLNHVKEMLQWVCFKKPNIERKSCPIFSAIIDASTPTLLGGKPNIAKKKFQKLLKSAPLNLLVRINYIQYSLIPLLEEDEFYSEMMKVKKEIDLWYSFVQGRVNNRNEKYRNAREFNLYNSIAKERYTVLWKLRKDLF